ncbi:large ribosomal subunit protein P1-like [Mustela nigripes]|nr:large ribosomal subunit protein P1-like [Mustela nigripes]
MVEGYLHHLFFGLPALLKQQFGPDSKDPNSLSTSLAPACTIASILEITCIYLTFTMHDDEVIQVRGNKLNALIKSPSVNVDPFCLSLSEKSLANINIRIFIWNVGASGSALVAGAAPAGGPVPSITAAPAQKEVEAKKEESEKSDDDMGFGIFTTLLL